MKKPGITRRQLAAPLAAAPLLSQTTPTPTPQSELTAAREQGRRNGEQLRKTSVPTLLEPSFAFRP